MKEIKDDTQGFTLLELLVVVLIIGILASIALPQYQSAVRKARVAEAKIALRALVDATDRWLLQNDRSRIGEIDEELDIDISNESQNWNIYRDECLDGCIAIAEPKWEEGYFIQYYSNSYYIDDPRNGKFICLGDNNEGKNICKQLGGTSLFEDDDTEYQI